MRANCIIFLIENTCTVLVLHFSHFDGVRSLTFHPVEPVLITASEDHTLKLWNLQKTVPAKKYDDQFISYDMLLNTCTLQHWGR